MHYNSPCLEQTCSGPTAYKQTDTYMGFFICHILSVGSKIVTCFQNLPDRNYFYVIAVPKGLMRGIWIDIFVFGNHVTSSWKI